MFVVGIVMIGAGAFLSFGWRTNLTGVDMRVLGMCLAAVGVVLAVTATVRRGRTGSSGVLPPVSAPLHEAFPSHSPGTVPVYATAPAMRGPDPSGSLLTRVKAFRPMMQSRRTGEYTLLAPRQVTLWVLALVSIASPLDPIPDLLPLIGVTDDAGLMVWLLTTLSVETGRYVTWRRDADRDKPHPIADVREPGPGHTTGDVTEVDAR